MANEEVKRDVALKEEPHDTDVKDEVKEETTVETSVVMARLREILSTVDLETTTEKMLRKRLEEEFKSDFTDLKAAIRSEIEAYLDSKAEEAEEEQEEEAKPVKKKAKAGGGFGKLCRLSPALAKFLGVERESRTQVVKKIWDYIKEHNLQDPKDRRRIKPDETLKAIFPTTVTMFSMNKHLTKHIIQDDGGSGASKSKKRKGSDDEDDDDDDDEDGSDSGGEDDDYKAPAKAKAKKAKSSGGAAPSNSPFTRPLKLSSQLSELVGVPQMSRPELTKYFNKYFKEEGLLDPSDKRVVLCNDTLKTLFQVDSFRAFGEIHKLLKPHLT